MRAARPPGAPVVLRWIFGSAVAAMCALAFAWPYAVSADPSHPVFKPAAIAALVVFLAALVALLTWRVRDSSKHQAACRARRT